MPSIKLTEYNVYITTTKFHKNIVILTSLFTLKCVHRSLSTVIYWR